MVTVMFTIDCDGEVVQFICEGLSEAEAIANGMAEAQLHRATAVLDVREVDA